MRISDAVARIIERDGNLRMRMDEGLINYYAFARKHQAEIREMVGREASIGSISMAARRHVSARAMSGAPLPSVPLEIVVSNRMIDYNVKCAPQVFDELAVFYSSACAREVNISVYKDRLTLIAHERNEPLIERHRCIADNVIFKIRDLACLHLRFGADFLNTPGMICEALKSLQSKGINVLEVLTSSKDMMLAIKEDNLKVAYRLLKGRFAQAEA